MIEIVVGQVAQMRKKHPCGSFTWTIDRIGLDIGMVCTGCQRRVLLPRSQFNKRLKKIVQE